MPATSSLCPDASEFRLSEPSDFPPSLIGRYIFLERPLSLDDSDLPPLVTDEHLSLLEFLRQYKLQAFSQVLQEAEFDVAALQLSNLEDMAEVGICAAGAKEIMFCVEKLNKTLMFKKQREQKLFADKMGSQEKRGGGEVPQMTMHKLEAPPPALLQMQHWSLEQAIGWCTAFLLLYCYI